MKATYRHKATILAALSAAWATLVELLAKSSLSRALKALLEAGTYRLTVSAPTLEPLEPVSLTSVPIVPNPLELPWFQALEQAAQFDPAHSHLVTVALPDDDPKGKILSTLPDPGCLLETLHALSLRFLKARGVFIAEPESLAPLFLVRNPQDFEVGGEPP